MSCLVGEDFQATRSAPSRNQSNSNIFFSFLPERCLCSAHLCLRCQLCLNAPESAECLVFHHCVVVSGMQFTLIHL